MAEIKKFFCVKDLIIYDPFTKHKYKGNNLYGILCKKGNIYDLCYNTDVIIPYYDIITGYILTDSELNEHFITLEKFREQQINKILNNV